MRQVINNKRGVGNTTVTFRKYINGNNYITVGTVVVTDETYTTGVKEWLDSHSDAQGTWHSVPVNSEVD